MTVRWWFVAMVVVGCSRPAARRDAPPVESAPVSGDASLADTLAALRDIGFLETVKRGQIALGVAHILGPSIASLNEIADIAPFVADGKYYLVKNFINETSFFDWDQSTYDSYFKKIKDAVEITIPKLNEMAYEQVELASVPFVTFVANKGPHDAPANYSFVLRGYVRHWLGNVWAEYDRVKLPDLVTPSITPAGKSGEKGLAGRAAAIHEQSRSGQS